MSHPDIRHDPENVRDEDFMDALDTYVELIRKKTTEDDDEDASFGEDDYQTRGYEAGLYGSVASR